jgi:hypothetical protein
VRQQRSFKVVGPLGGLQQASYRPVRRERLETEWTIALAINRLALKTELVIRRLAPRTVLPTKPDELRTDSNCKTTVSKDAMKCAIRFKITTLDSIFGLTIPVGPQ